MSTKRRAFSAITIKSATILHRALPFAREAGYAAVTFEGGWQRRRFILINGHGKRELPANPANPLALTLSVPVTLSPPELMTALRSFGASVERLWRANEQGHFDLVVSETDGHRHMVHRYHHIALCGHKSTNWLSDDEVGSFASEVQSCPKCTTAAATTPAYRARWHPAVTDYNERSQRSIL